MTALHCLGFTALQPNTNCVRVLGSSQASPVLIQKLECMVPQVLGHLASSLLDLWKYLQVRTQLNSFHINVCSDHSLDNCWYCLPTSKLKLWIFVKINNDEHFYVKYGWWMDIPWENWIIFAFWCLKYSTCNKIIFSFQ